MASLIDMLLSADPERLCDVPKASLTIKRLSAMFGEEFVLDLQGLSRADIDSLPKGDMNVHVVLRGITNIDFSNRELADRFKPAGRSTPLTPVELLRIIFLPGEIAAIEKTVMELSGYGENLVEKIEKN